MARQNLFMFNHWMLASSAGSQGGWGMITRGSVRPSYHTYQLYSKFGSQMLYSASGIDNVNVYAAKREDGSLTLMIVNLNETDQTVPLQFKGRSPSSAQLYLLDPEHNAQDMGTVNLPEDGAITLPGESVSLYIINPR